MMPSGVNMDLIFSRNSGLLNASGGEIVFYSDELISMMMTEYWYDF